VTLLTEAPMRTPHSVGNEGGEVSSADFAVLGLIHQEPRWCPNCGGEQTFVPVYEIHIGRVGYCLGCGEERVVPFSRTNSEAA
jgi:hypothetical protein